MKSSELRKRVAEAISAAQAKKAEAVTVLQMDQESPSFTDYFVIASGSNPRQIQAIADEVEERLARVGLNPTSVEGYRQAEWVLLDYVDFVVHVFSEKARKYYDLERLWKSAARLEPSELKPARKRAARPRSAPRTRKRGKGSRGFEAAIPCHPERARLGLARESKDPYTKTIVRVGVLRLARATPARARSA
ncbi:MAG: ribosome silencing factor [Terriglobales bacterium]